ncbi:UNVERIFIED_CONTAM: YbbR domain-containing protein [Acetivibrio alkalicellulosi]
MSELLKKDSTTKIISLFFAVILWFFVLDSSNPVISYDLSIPLRVENEDVLRENGLIILNKNFPRNVSVSFRGRQNKMGKINDNEVEAILDLSKITSVETQNLHIEIYISKEGYSVENVTPRFVSLELEKVGKNSFPVSVVTIGEPKENYKIIGVSAMPSTVFIEDKDTIINSIGEIKAYVDVSNISSDLAVQKQCVFYDIDGEVMEDLDFYHSVDIKIEIAKEIPIVPVVKGKPARNYIDGIHRVVPDKALISGVSDVIELIDNVRTETIDIDNMSQSMTKMVNIELPEGVRLVDTPRSVYVDVVIEQMAFKEFVFRSREILLENQVNDNSLNYTIEDEILITIAGRGEELEKIAIEGLKPSIDVGGLREGVFKRAIKVVLPRTVKLQENYEVEVVIEKNEDMDEE